MTHTTRNLRSLVATVVGMATLAVPATALALPSSDPYADPTPPPPAPDLVVTGTVEDVTYRRSDGGTGHIAVFALTVRNQGNLKAGPFLVTVRSSSPFCCDSDGLTTGFTKYFAGLGANASGTLGVVRVYDQQAVTVVAVADSDNRVNERVETNNRRTLTYDRTVPRSH